MKKLSFEVYIIVQKPVAQVFDAVYNPKKLIKYFTTQSASAPLDAGTTVYWDFADFPGKFPVYVRKSVKNKTIAFDWASVSGDYNTRTTFHFKRLGPRNTKVTVTESGWPLKHLQHSYGNCYGWTQMTCALKAYLEYGINLRKGAFK